MKTRLVLAIMVVAALTSCAEKTYISTEPSTKGRSMSFTVQTIETRTVLAEGRKTYWSGSEAISIFDGTSNNKFTAQLASPSATATFTGEANQSESYVALYPYNASASLSADVISTVIPENQIAIEGTFDPSSVVLVGMSKDANMQLTNVCSLLKITVPDGVSSIEVEGNGTPIAGNISIDLADGNAVSGATQTKVVLAKSDKSALSRGTYYVAVAPGKLDGVTVTLKDAVNKRHMTRKVESSRTLAGNVIYDMGEFGTVRDVKYLYDDSFCENASIYNTPSMTESTESPASGNKCLKWVLQSADAWSNYAVIALPTIDIKDIEDPSKACFVYKFKVDPDNGPSQCWNVFHPYFVRSNDAGDYQLGKGIGRDSASEYESNFDLILRDTKWHEITVPLAECIQQMKDKSSAITGLGFTPAGESAAVGTTIYFDDIRLVGCCLK